MKDNNIALESLLSDTLATVAETSKNIMKQFTLLGQRHQGASEKIDSFKSFKALSKIKVRTPHRFKGNLADYIEDFEHLNESVVDEASRILRMYEVEIANIIASKGEAMSVAALTEVFKQADALNSQIHVITKKYRDWPRESDNGYMILGDVCSSVDELKYIIDQAAKPYRVNTPEGVKTITDLTERATKVAEASIKATEYLIKSGLGTKDIIELIASATSNVGYVLDAVARLIYHREITIEAANQIIKEINKA